jgi:hypothetical protein
VTSTSWFAVGKFTGCGPWTYLVDWFAEGANYSATTTLTPPRG